MPVLNEVYLITATCAEGHSQQLKIAAILSRQYAEVMAGLMDGTSAMYRYPPGQESMIGKCGICGSKIKCEVSNPTVL